MQDNRVDAANGRAQTSNADRSGAQPCVTIIAGQPTNGRWWDAPYRKPVVPAAWSAAGLVDSISLVQIPALGGDLVPYSDAHTEGRVVRNYSFVAVAIRSLDAAGNRVDLPQSVQTAIHRKAVEGRMPGSLMVSRSGQCFVVFLLARSITGKEQPGGKPTTPGVFYLASKGAEWLVDESLRSLDLSRARPTAIQTGYAVARSRGTERSNAPDARSVIRLTDGLAVQAILSETPGIPIDGGVLSSTATKPAEYLTLAEKLWQSEELASYAPAVPTSQRDAVWEFVQALRDEPQRKKASARIRKACEDLANSGVSEVGKNWPSSLESSIDELGRFATLWSDGNERLLSVGLPPLGAEAGSPSSAVLSYDSIWNPASIFTHELRNNLSSGSWHVAVDVGGAPRGLGVSLSALGWRLHETDESRGCFPWVPSGLCVGWIDYIRHELLLDIETVTRNFASPGATRCARLCMKPTQLARVLADAGLLADPNGTMYRRKLSGESRKVIRMRFDSVLLVQEHHP